MVVRAARAGRTGSPAVKPILIRPEGDGPLYLQVYRGVRAAIVEGRIAPGSSLPSTRALSQELRVSRNVILSAFDQLLDEGYVEGRVGSGTYVAQQLPEISIHTRSSRPEKPRANAPPQLSRHARQVLASKPLPPPGDHPEQRLRFDFRYGHPALEEFPQAVWTRLATKRLRSLSLRTLAYARVRGYLPLREAIVEYVRRARGVQATADQVFIVSGTQQAFDLTARMLIDQGDRVIVEEPCYQAARQIFQSYGARVIPVPVDHDGLQVHRLPRGKEARLAYVTPSHHFPIGGILPRERRLELLQWAEDTGAYLLEDDYDSEFRYDTKPVEALQGLDRSGRVLYVGSFSKVVFPSLRLGYMLVPEEMVPALSSLKFLTDIMAPTFEQEVLADFLSEGHFERHIHRMRVLYGARRSILLEALRGAFGDRLEVFGADAGLHVMIRLRGLGASEVPALLARAAGDGVGIYPVAPYYQQPSEEAGLILGYAGLPERDLRAGVQAFAEVLEAHEANGASGASRAHAAPGA